MPAEPGVDEARRGVRQQPEPAEARLALQPRGDVVGQGHALVGRGQHELARVQHERILGGHLHEPGQLRLLQRRVDHRVLVVVEQPEVPVDPDVDARGLHHLLVERLEHDATGVDLGADVPVGEQHPHTVLAARLRPRWPG